jgi:hypothetical protein
MKFGNILTYFIDDTETFSLAMRIMRMDTKYNTADFFFKDFYNPSKKKLI